MTDLTIYRREKNGFNSKNSRYSHSFTVQCIFWRPSCAFQRARVERDFYDRPVPERRKCRVHRVPRCHHATRFKHKPTAFSLTNNHLVFSNATLFVFLHFVIHVAAQDSPRLWLIFYYWPLLGRFVVDTVLHKNGTVIYLISLYNAQYNLTVNTVCKNTGKCAYVFWGHCQQLK